MIRVGNDRVALQVAVMAFASSLLTRCSDAGQESVALELRLAGTEVTEPVAAASGFEVELELAQLAFGPLYLCPGFQAGGFCETARVEWLGSAVVDVLNAEPDSVGELRGVTGAVRSYMYDLGITSLLTLQQPLPLEAATGLGGNSLRLEGIARRDGQALPFEIELPIRQELASGRGIPVVLKTNQEDFMHTITTGDDALTLRFDARSWVGGIDFDGVLADRPCEDDGGSVGCLAGVEQQCNTDGTVAEQTDCVEQGQACVAGLGCIPRLQILPETQPYRAVRNAVIAGQRPSFDWSGTP